MLETPSLMLLLVEDHRPLARALARTLQRRGHRVTVVHGARDARDRGGVYECGIFDIDLPDGNGLDLADEMLERGTVLHAVFFTASIDPEVARRARALGSFVSKQHGLEELVAAIGESVAAATAVAAGAERDTPAPNHADHDSGFRPRRGRKTR
jgi:DNA-binding response OmpR family regulator